MSDIYDEDTLAISGHEMATEFELATHHAIENMLEEFEFHGYIVETTKAIDVVQEMLARRTYH